MLVDQDDSDDVNHEELKGFLKKSSWLKRME